MWDQMQEPVLNALVTILCGLLSIAVAYATAWIAKMRKLAAEKAQGIKDDNARKFTQDALQKLQTVTDAVVRETEQTVAGAMRQAVADGKVDKSELEALGTQAVTKIKNTLSNSVINYLTITFAEDLDGFIKSLVEGAVLKLKAEGNPA